ncbi:MAG: sulfurtransferase [Candidatus Paracaedimonas acanthamoebae]|uniref:Sulfurtransferase n=1 Tax=Candidatus Paracaedimonas acanthamoebae TaxID=244581 RepID=A0A8J7PV88_9PROT|nr:sulfurtransferase [Candidatus Paracaedimonas acanthamoebae]
MESLEITVQELHQFLGTREDYCIIDVRNTDEIEKAAFPGALHIPLSVLPRSVVNIPQDKLVITLCHHGARSLKACYLLKEQGFDKVVSLRGGIDLWSQLIDPSIPRY